MERDRHLPEEPPNEFGEDDVERQFNDESDRAAELEAGHGPSIDPDQDESASQDSD